MMTPNVWAKGSDCLSQSWSGMFYISKPESESESGSEFG